MPRFRTRSQAFVGLLLLGSLLPLGLGCGSDDVDSTEQPQYTPPPDPERERIELGLNLSPVAVNLDGKDRDLVGLGSYIVNAQSGCNDCHTNPPYAPGGNPFMGQVKQINTTNFLGGGVPFGPGIVSKNITPDANGLPAGLNVDQFLAIMRTGLEEDGALLQVMPWPVFQSMSERDLRAIYEYLRSIPHAEPGTAPPPAP